MSSPRPGPGEPCGQWPEPPRPPEGGRRRWSHGSLRGLEPPGPFVPGARPPKALLVTKKPETLLFKNKLQSEAGLAAWEPERGQQASAGPGGVGIQEEQEERHSPPEGRGRSRPGLGCRTHLWGVRDLTPQAPPPRSRDVSAADDSGRNRLPPCQRESGPGRRARGPRVTACQRVASLRAPEAQLPLCNTGSKVASCPDRTGHRRAPV